LSTLFPLLQNSNKITIVTTARDLLLKHYLDWQRAEGERKTFIQFAKYVGISNKQLEHVFNGRRDISETIARRLAVALNDYRFYDIAGLDRPPPNTAPPNYNRLPKSYKLPSPKTPPTCAPSCADSLSASWPNAPPPKYAASSNTTHPKHKTRLAAGLVVNREVPPRGHKPYDKFILPHPTRPEKKELNNEFFFYTSFLPAIV